MKRRLVSLLLTAVLLLACLPVTAFAETAKNITVYAPGYNSSNALVSITASFDWSSGKAGVSEAQFVLMDKPLSGSTEGSSGWGDFSDAGAIFDLGFDDYADAKAYNGNTYGMITASGITSIGSGEQDKEITLNFADHPIAPTDGNKYYVYLWVKYRGNYYPDNLICVIQFKNGVLSYTPAIPGAVDYRNYYEDNFTQVTPTKPDENTTAPSGHSCVKSGWLWDNTYHWHRACTDPSCPSYTQLTDKAVHNYSNDHDTTCNTCGYTRTAPAEHPNTGDITNIPLWTTMLFAGVAALWVQLTQRKRQRV